MYDLEKISVNEANRLISFLERHKFLIKKYIPILELVCAAGVDGAILALKAMVEFKVKYESSKEV